MRITCLVSVLMTGLLAVGELRAAEEAGSSAVANNVGVDLPGVAGDEPFLTEEWPGARTLVWAKPGTTGMAMSSGNWTEYASAADYLAKKGARPATQPPDENTDIILPIAPDGEPYVVGYMVESFRRRGGLDHPQWACRHVTIGKGAGLDGGARTSRGGASFGDRPSADTAMAIYGNVTVEDGGYLYGPRYFLGNKHTYFFMGNSPEPLDKSWTIRKTNGASVTLLGNRCDLAKGVAIESGRLVLHAKSELRFGAGYESRIALKKLRNLGHFQEGGYVNVHKTAALEMRAGSRIGRMVEPDNTIADLRIEGLLQIGRANDEDDEPAVIELGMAEGSGGFLTQQGGLYIRPTANVENFGKLAITAYRPAIEATAHKGVSVFLETTVDLGDVNFDYLRAGGVAAIDLKTAKASVTGATFGDHCAATGDELFSKFHVNEFRGGPGTVEFVDGLKTDCKILFPHAGRLIVRGKGNRTLQSFDLMSVHAVTIDGGRTEFNAKRSLNDQEAELRRKNALWGDVPGKGQCGKYADQEWPDCPVMIWAHPGTSGFRFSGANWLDETGTPYFEVPLISQRNIRTDNPDIDILLPAADTAYQATGWGAGGNEGSPPSRHLTVEYNATYGITYNVQGNLWMKHGSGLVGKHRGRFDSEQPNVHRFLRFDGERAGHDGTLVDGLDACIGQWGFFRAGEGSTLELIGRIRCAADRSYIFGPGTIVLSEGAALADGTRAAFFISAESTVVFLEDAQLGAECSMQSLGCASISCNGTLMFGLPDRPIRRDTALAVAGLKSDQVNRALGGGGRSPGASLILSPQGRFVVHSVDPNKARVFIKMHDSERAKKASRDEPEGIVCYFAGDVELNGVVFDNVLEGGIVTPAATRATWKNIFYGEHNLAEPEKLYWDLEVKDEK